MFKVNKNLSHNGKVYAAGDEIKESAEGFKGLLQSGHVDKVEGASVSKPEVQAPMEMPVAEIPMEEPVVHKKKHKKEH